MGKVKNEIAEWLDGSEFNFEEGFALFCKYNRNRSIQSYLARKQNREKLLYELEKMRKQELKEANVKNETFFKVIKESNAPLKTVGNNKLINVNRADLPDDIKVFFDKNTERHKEMRSLHEKMKIADSDEKRAEFMAEIDSLDKANEAGWAVIDDFVKNNKKPEPKKEPVFDAKRVSANRTYISKGLKKLEKLKDKKKISALIEKMTDRAKELKDGGVDLAAETIEKLKAYGVDL